MKSKITSGPGSVSTAPLPHRMANALRLAQRNIRQLDASASLNEYGYAIRDQALKAIGDVLAEWDGLPSIGAAEDDVNNPLASPLADLLEWAKGNRGTRTGNPYMVPEVRAALSALARETGFEGHPSQVPTARPAADTKPLAGVSGSLLFQWLADGRKRCLCCGAPVPAGQSCACQADTFTPCPQCGAPKPVGRSCPCIPTA